MKLTGALLLTLSEISPASSVFIIAPGVIMQAGTGAFASFMLAALIGIFTAFVYAELASIWPLTGGEYAITGRVLGPLPGFVILGLNIASLILTIAVFALGVANYLGVIFPGLSPLTVALVTVLLATLCGVLNIRTNAVITGIFLAIEMVVLAGISYIGFTHINRPVSQFLVHPVVMSNGMMVPASLSVIGLATSVAIFAYNGYGQALYFGEETHDAKKHIVRTVLISLLITVIAEAAPLTAVLMGVPNLQSMFGSNNIIGDFITHYGGGGLNKIVSGAVALAILNAAIAIILLAARQLFSSGRDKAWSPGIDRLLTLVHPRFHSPWVATLICGALAAAACFIDLNMLLVLTGTGYVVVYAALCVAAIAGRRSGKTDGRTHHMPGYPLPPLIALGMLGYIIYANYQDPAVGRPSLIATAAMMALSALYYLLVLRRRGKWELQGPES